MVGISHDPTFQMRLPWPGPWQSLKAQRQNGSSPAAQPSEWEIGPGPPSGYRPMSDIGLSGQRVIGQTVLRGQHDRGHL